MCEQTMLIEDLRRDRPTPPASRGCAACGRTGRTRATFLYRNPWCSSRLLRAESGASRSTRGLRPTPCSLEFHQLRPPVHSHSQCYCVSVTRHGDDKSYQISRRRTARACATYYHRSAMPPTLLFCLAHPDDESFSGAGTIMKYADAGVRTVLVTGTLAGAARSVIRRSARSRNCRRTANASCATLWRSSGYPSCICSAIGTRSSPTRRRIPFAAPW